MLFEHDPLSREQAFTQTNRAKTSAARRARGHRGLRDTPRPASLRGSRGGNNRASARVRSHRATIPWRCARALPHAPPDAARAASETAPAARRELPQPPRSARDGRKGVAVAADRDCQPELPHPEERALARVSKDGREFVPCLHPSRRYPPYPSPACGGG